MPGRLLILEPGLAHGHMLETELSKDFFDVLVATNDTVFFDTLHKFAPDVVLISSNYEHRAKFATVRKLRDLAFYSHLPILLLYDEVDPKIWQNCHDHLIDDLLSYTAEPWQKRMRLNLLTRGKETVDLLMARQRTIRDMGFSEGPAAYPPPLIRRVIVDVSAATASFDENYLKELKSYLNKDFPLFSFRDGSQKSAERPADVQIIETKTQDKIVGLSILRDQRKAATKSAEKSIFITDPGDIDTGHKAIELGAHDIALGIPPPAELACRLRRLIWHNQMQVHGERTETDHLKSALIDPLTGLYNRRYVFQYLSHLLNRTHSKHTSVIVMVLDLDHFKRINDTYGHITGDRVLRETAHRIRANLRACDLVARLGGEEFLIVIKDTPFTQVCKIAQRLCHAISDTVFTTNEGVEFTVSTSIGVSASHGKWDSANAAIDNADRALFQAKDRGRNQVIFNDPPKVPQKQITR